MQRRNDIGIWRRVLCFLLIAFIGFAGADSIVLAGTTPPPPDPPEKKCTKKKCQRRGRCSSGSSGSGGSGSSSSYNSGSSSSSGGGGGGGGSSSSGGSSGTGRSLNSTYTYLAIKQNIYLDGLRKRGYLRSQLAQNRPSVSQLAQNRPTSPYPVRSSVSRNPVYYFNGEVEMDIEDMALVLDDPWFGHDRIYVNQLDGDYDGPNGYNWLIAQLPHIIETAPAPSQVLAVYAGDDVPIWFDKSGSDYVARDDPAGEYELTSVTLGDSSSGYRLRIGLGDQVEIIEFHDFADTAWNGVFYRHVDAFGNETKATSYTDNRITELQRVVTDGGVTTIYSLQYEYYGPLSDNPNKLQYLTLRKKVDAGAWSNQRRIEYAYHDGLDNHGSHNDLKTVTPQKPNGAAWTDVAKTYYRYYKGTYDATTNPGDPHLIKYVISPENYRRLVDAGKSITSTDADIAPFADFYFEYDSGRQVRKEVANAGCGGCGGGLGTEGDSFVRTTNPDGGYTDGYNNWETKTVVTYEDASTETVYSNYLGDPILKKFIDGTDVWRWYFRYDSDGQLILAASPSAVTGDSELDLDLVDYGGGGSKIAASAGLIETRAYYSSTTATTTTPGGVDGYLQYEAVKKGDSGTEVKLTEYKYLKHSYSGDDVFPVGTVIVYPDATTQTTTIEMNYTYTWHEDGSQVETNNTESVTTILPLVPTAQNGPGGTAYPTASWDNPTTVVFYDTDGNLTWTKDEREVITRKVYDAPTGLLTQRIDDVDTTQTTDEPSGWTTPTGTAFGSHAVTDYTYDDLGRMIEVLGPSHTVDLSHTATTIRPAGWMVYVENGPTAKDEARSASGYATGSAGSYTYTLINPVSIVKQGKDGRNTYDVIVAKRSSTVGKLLDTDTFTTQTDWFAWTVNNYQDDGRLEYTRAYHSIPTSGPGLSGTNYDQTDFAYDPDTGRRIKVKTPEGTITRTVFDARGRATGIWGGTDDTGATVSDPDAGSSNLLQVSAFEYDSGNDEDDGYLTKITQYADGADTRDIIYTYDFRGRQLTEDGEVDRYAKTTYDNLGRATQVDQYHTAETGTSPVGNLIARTKSEYDDRGRVYQTVTTAVDPANGTTGNSLTSNTWYDAASNVIKSKVGGTQVFSKSVYDGLSRVIESYVGYDTAETAYADADDVTSDTVVQQSEATFDDAGNTLEVTNYQRDHDGTGTGKLTTSNARLAHRAFWYDGGDRLFTSANYGTNGGSAFTRDSTAPTASDTVLVTITDYDDAGRTYKITDPAGAITRTFFDHAGRTTHVAEGYATWTNEPTAVPPYRNSDVNRVTAYTYTADGQIQTLTAVDPDHDGVTSDNQVTNYIYGVTTTGGSDINSNRLLHAVIYPESDDVVSPLGDGANGYDRVEMSYNRLGQLTSRKDQREAVHDYTYDKLGRLTKDTVSALGRSGEAVDGAVVRVDRSYEVRGMLEKVTTYDDVSAVVNEVQMAYNDFRQLKTDYQDHDTTVDTTPGTGSPRTSYDYEPGSDPTKGTRRNKLTFPNDRELHYLYTDAGGGSGVSYHLSRISSLATATTRGTSDANVIAGYEYLGMGTVVRKDYPGPEIRLDYWGGTSGTYDGFDDFGRVAAQRWVDYSGTETDVFHIKHGYDRASNRRYADRQVYGSHSQTYAYDDLHRLDVFKAGLFNGNTSSPDIEAYWNLRKQDFNLDQLGNQVDIDTREGTDYIKTTHDKANQIDVRTTQGSQYPSYEGDEFSVDSSSDWVVPTGATETVSVTSGSLAFSGTFTADTLSGNMEQKGSGTPVDDTRAIALLGESIGPFTGRLYVDIPNGGQAGWVFGYKDANDYWTYVYDEPADKAYLYHVEDGNKGDPLDEAGITAFSSGVKGIDVNFRRGSFEVLDYDFPGGFPSGKIGVYADTTSTEFDYIRVYNDDSPPILAGRWIGNAIRPIDTTEDNLPLTISHLTNENPVMLDGVRVDRFDAAFTIKQQDSQSGTSSGAKFIFNATDQDDYDYVSIIHSTTGNTAPTGYEVVDGDYATLVTGDQDATYVPAFTNRQAKMYVRVIYDGTYLKVFTGTDDTNVNNKVTADEYAYRTNNLKMTGGMIGFASTSGYPRIDDVVLKAHRDTTGNGTPDTWYTEYEDDFTLDINGYVDDTLKHDAAGNLTYDGRHEFIYDAWNRLVKVKHAYRDTASPTDHIVGSTVATMQYDGLSRRTVKTITSSAGQDGTYNYYYNGQSVIQIDNGSNEMLKQYVWGAASGGYIDELCQVGVNQDPANASSSKNAGYKENEAEYYYYPMQDANFNNLGIVNEAGRLVERYEYTPYGQRITYSHGVLRGDVNGDGSVGIDDLNLVLSPNWNQNVTGPDPADINGDGYVSLLDLNVVNGNWNAGYTAPDDTLTSYPRPQSARFTSNGTANEGPALCEVGHQGLMHDEEFGSQGGLVYNRARMLNARLGRFMQRDPLGYVDGLSMYQYVASNPIMWLDSSGAVAVPGPGDPGKDPRDWACCNDGKQKTMDDFGRDCCPKELRNITLPYKPTDLVNGRFGHSGIQTLNNPIVGLWPKTPVDYINPNAEGVIRNDNSYPFTHRKKYRSCPQSIRKMNGWLTDMIDKINNQGINPFGGSTNETFTGANGKNGRNCFGFGCTAIEAIGGTPPAPPTSSPLLVPSYIP